MDALTQAQQRLARAGSQHMRHARYGLASCAPALDPETAAEDLRLLEKATELALDAPLHPLADRLPALTEHVFTR